MAEYHLHLGVLQRSAGRSSVAAAAYISGSQLQDKRQGMTWNYTRKERVIEEIVIAPDGSALDREAFWNAVENKHTRRDAVTARTMEIALPKELDPDDAWELAQDFAHEIARSYHVGVDCCMHYGKNQMFHTHYQMSSCRVNDDGTLGKKVVELDAKHCLCNGLETPADVLRPYWQDLCNSQLQELNFTDLIDHRSYKDRGIDRIPQVKEGYGPSAEWRREINAQIAIRNAEVEQGEKLAAMKARWERDQRVKNKPAKQTTPEPLAEVAPKPVATTTEPAQSVVVELPAQPTPGTPKRGLGSPDWDSWYRLGRAINPTKWAAEHPEPPTPEQYGALSAGALDTYLASTGIRAPLYKATSTEVIPQTKEVPWIAGPAKESPGLKPGDPRWNDWYIQGRQGYPYQLPPTTPTREEWQALSHGMQDKERARQGQQTAYQVEGRNTVVPTTKLEHQREREQDGGYER